MPATYLYLNEPQRIKNQGGKIVWRNLPTISRTSRQCYLSVSLFGLELTGNANFDELFLVKMNIATDNYYSSDNDGVVVCMLDPTRIVSPRSVYQLSLGSGEPMRIMTNDNYDRLEFSLITANGQPFSVPDAWFVNIVLKFEYPEVDSVQKEYVATIPKNLL